MVSHLRLFFKAHFPIRSVFLLDSYASPGAQFRIVRSQKEMEDFFAKVDKVNSKLSDFPPFFEGKEKEYDGRDITAKVPFNCSSERSGNAGRAARE